MAYKELYTVYKRWCSEVAQTRPESQEDMLAGIERVADKGKMKLSRSSREGYTLSSWVSALGEKELVAPALKGTKKPQVLRGVRVNHEASGWLVGQDLPAGSLFEV